MSFKLEERAPNRGIVFYKGRGDVAAFDIALENLRVEVDKLGGNLVVCAEFLEANDVKAMCVVDGSKEQPGDVLNSVLEALNEKGNDR